MSAEQQLTRRHDTQEPSIVPSHALGISSPVVSGSGSTPVDEDVAVELELVTSALPPNDPPSELASGPVDEDDDEATAGPLDEVPSSSAMSPPSDAVRGHPAVATSMPKISRRISPWPAA